MNTLRKKYTTLTVVLCLIMVCIQYSCTKDFADINTDPKVINEFNVDYMLTYGLREMRVDPYGTWFYNGFTYQHRWCQFTLPGGGNNTDMNQSGNMGGTSRVGAVIPALFETRRLISIMPQEDQDKRKCYVAMTYVAQVYEMSKDIMLEGSRPYSEAYRGRFEGIYEPKWDTQPELLSILITELNDAVNVLMTNKGDINQYSPGIQDVYYFGNWDNWIRLANAIKLRIAMWYYQNQDINEAKKLIKEAAEQSLGFWTDRKDEFWIPYTEDSGGTDVSYQNPHGARNLINFLKENNDPRLSIFFEKNSFTPEVIQLFKDNNVTIPDYIDYTNDPLYRYQGGPVSPDLGNEEKYFRFPVIAGTSYRPISYINRKFFNTYYDYSTPVADGYWCDIFLSYNEVCFHMAEAIEKGLYTGGKTAKEWYDTGVKECLWMFDKMAQRAILLDYPGITQADVDAYLAKPKVAYTGTQEQKIEKIAVQQWLSYYRYPNEAYVHVRRTSYPKRGSSIIAWEPFNVNGIELLAFPRRLIVREPLPGERNGDNVRAAFLNDGFTMNATDPVTLERERVWWDKNNPSLGSGWQP